MADADSRYHGMQLRVERRPGAKGLHLSGSLTWSSQINTGGGWSLQAISSFQDGPWFSVYLPGDALDMGSEFSQWPDRIGNPNLPPDQQTPSRWFDTDAFVRPDGFRYGNAGRTTVEGPGLANVDLSLRRRFRLSEGQNLELRLQMFNAANRAKFVLRRKARVNQFGTADFGALGEASPARQVQVALKYSF